MSVTVNEDNTDEWVREFTTALGRGLERVGLAAERNSKLICPVDTGRLRNSITHEVVESDKSVYIGTNVEYAPYVELGTYRQRAQPFLVPAARDHADEYRELLKSELIKSI